MYVVHTSYTAPLEEIDYVLPSHSEWLTKQFEAGYFLASGRCPDRAGDVIIASPMPRTKLNVILATDPFVLNRLVHHEVVEFQVGRTAPGLLRYNEAALPG